VSIVYVFIGKSNIELQSSCKYIKGLNSDRYTQERIYEMHAVDDGKLDIIFTTV